MSEALAVVRVGVCCPIGLDTRQTAASIRAGVSRKRETEILDGELEPVIMGTLADAYLPSISPALRKRVRASPLEPRLLRLATRPLLEVLSGEFARVELPMYLGTPAPLPGYPLLSDGFVAMLAVQAERGVSLGASRVFAEGRSGMFSAIAAARRDLLDPRRAEFVVVGGVDSYLDDERIAALERAGRLRTGGPQDAFTPGEAAAFLILATAATCRRHAITPVAWISALGLSEPLEPRRATLAAACSAALDQPRPNADPIRVVMAGLNGESRSAQAWGVAYLRNREHFIDPVRVDHPAEYVGDCGAALAPLMLATATRLLRVGVLAGPALIWACADAGRSGALVLYPGG